MFWVFNKFFVRYWRRHWVLAILDALAVALGAGVFLAIQLLNQSSLRAFNASVDAVAGKADWQAVSTGSPFADTVFPEIRFHPRVRAAAPIVEEILPLARRPDDYLRLIGIDPFSQVSFQTFESIATQEDGPDFESFLFRKNAVLLHPEFGESRGLNPGDTLEALGPRGREVLTVAGYFERRHPASELDVHLAFMDIAAAQELLGKQGGLDRIDVMTRDGLAPDVALPGNAIWQRPEFRGHNVGRMLSAFQLNLTALSLIALYVGMFLIYNTVSAEAARRRRDIGILRSIGMTRRQIGILFMLHAGVLGVLGVMVGVPLGILLARLSLGMISGTISSLYFLVDIQSVFLSSNAIGLAIVAGLASVTIAAWRPARAAALSPPIAAMKNLPLNDSNQALLIWPVWGGAVCGLTAGLAAWGALADGPRWLGFVAAFFLLTGFAFLAPLSVLLLQRAFHALSSRAVMPVVRIGVSFSLANMKRTGTTVASVASALAMMVGVAVMIHGFRMTVDHWIGQSIQADLYASPASQLHLGPKAFMPANVLKEIQGNADVRAWDTYRELNVWIDGNEVVVGASDMRTARRESSPIFVEGEPEAIWEKVATGPAEAGQAAAMISESLARRLDWSAGRRIEMPTPVGLRTVEIAGVFRDYSSDQGILRLDRRWVEAYWNDARFHSLALYLKEGVDLEAAERWIRSVLPQDEPYRVFSNRELKGKILEIFDRTFAVTYLLRLTAIVVAVMGIALTMTTLVMERTREFGLLRSLGFTKNQIRRIILLESVFIGGLGYVQGLAAGIGLAWILIEVVNPCYFGWTLDWHWPWFVFTWGPLLTLTAAVAAGWLPARRAERLKVIEALREE